MKKTTNTTRRRGIKGNKAERINVKQAKEEALRKEIKWANAQFEKMHLGKSASGVVISHKFEKTITNRSRKKCREMIGRELTVYLLEYGKSHKKLNTNGKEILSLLERASMIEMSLWDNRHSHFSVTKALEMYQAASKIETMASPHLPENKRKLVELGRKSLKSNINALNKIKTDNPNARVKVKPSVLLLAVEAAIIRAGSLKPTAGTFVNMGSDQIKSAVLKALPNTRH